MINLKLLFVVANLLCISLLSFSQSSQRQKYIYADNSVMVSLRSDKISYEKDDTIKLILTVKNISEKEILIFEEPYFKFHYSFNNDSILVIKSDKITLDFGNNFVGGTSTWKDMIKLEPSEAKKFNLYLKADRLTTNDYPSYTNFLFGMGYIDNVEKIKTLERSGSYLKTQIKDNIISLDTIIIEFLLTRFEVQTFGIHLK